jgi:hypothetical protein
MNRKGRLLNRGTAQVLRTDASPRGVNCICLQRRGFTRLCGAGAPFRPLFSSPRSVVHCSGAEDFPFTTRPNRPCKTQEVYENEGLMSTSDIVEIKMKIHQKISASKARKFAHEPSKFQGFKMTHLAWAGNPVIGADRRVSAGRVIYCNSL